MAFLTEIFFVPYRSLNYKQKLKEQLDILLQKGMSSYCLINTFAHNSWSSDRTPYKVIWGIYALLWDVYQVPKLSCFCEFVHIQQILLYQIEIACGRWPQNQMQGSNQVPKWSLHEKIWVLEMKNKKVRSKGDD